MLNWPRYLQLSWTKSLFEIMGSCQNYQLGGLHCVLSSWERVWVLNNWWNPAKLYKKKAPKRRKEKETRSLEGPKSRQANSQKKAGCREESEPLRTEPSIKPHEASTKKKGGKPHKTSSLEEPSLHAWSISTKEKGGKPDKTPSLEKLSLHEAYQLKRRKVNQIKLQA